MTDLELLEAAAKAMGEKVPPRFFDNGTACLLSGQHWNPLTDDGDALRLAVKLGLNVFTANMVEKYGIDRVWVLDDEKKADPFAATRRAIVRAAAAMAKP
jgi:hypothetical protein